MVFAVDAGILTVCIVFFNVPTCARHDRVVLDLSGAVSRLLLTLDFH